MVAETHIRFKGQQPLAAGLGTYSKSNLQGLRFTGNMAAADTATFGHQTTAAPQFSGWRTWATKGLITLATLSPIATTLTSCGKEKVDPIVVVDPTNTGKLVDAITPNSGKTTRTWTPENGASYSLTAQVKDAAIAAKYNGKTATLEVPYTSWAKDSTEEIAIDRNATIAVQGKQITITSKLPFTSKATGAISKGTQLVFDDGGTQERFLLATIAEDGQLSNVNDVAQLSNNPFTIGNGKGYYTEVASGIGATSKRTAILPYSNLRNITSSTEAKSIIRDQLINRIGLSTERADLFLSKFDDPKFNEATGNNNQTKGLALALAAVSPANDVFDALVGNVEPRLYMVEGNPSSGSIAQASVVTKNGKPAYQIMTSTLFNEIDLAAAAPALYGNEWLELEGTSFEKAKNKEVAQAMIQDFLWLKQLNDLPFAKAKELFEQTNPIIKSYNMNLAAQRGSDEKLKRRLPNSKETKLYGNLTPSYTDLDYRERIRSSYPASYPNISTVPTGTPIKVFATKGLGADLNRFPSTYSDSYLDALQEALLSEAKRKNYWSRFDALAKLDPQLSN